MKKWRKILTARYFIYFLRTSNPCFPLHQRLSSTGGISITDIIPPTCNNTVATKWNKVLTKQARQKMNETLPTTVVALPRWANCYQFWISEMFPCGMTKRTRYTVRNNFIPTSSASSHALKPDNYVTTYKQVVSAVQAEKTACLLRINYT